MAVQPTYHVKGNMIFQRSFYTSKGVTMGFAVCEVINDVDPNELCALMNEAENARHADRDKTVGR